MNPKVDPAGSISNRRGSAVSHRSEDAISISSANNKVTYSPKSIVKKQEERKRKAAESLERKPAAVPNGLAQKEDEDPDYDDVIYPTSSKSPGPATASSVMHSTPVHPQSTEEQGRVAIARSPAGNAEADPDAVESRPSTASSDFGTPSPTFPGEAAASLIRKTPAIGGAPLALSFDTDKSFSFKSAFESISPANGYTDREVETSSKQSTLKSEEKTESAAREPVSATSAPVTSVVTAQRIGRNPQPSGGWKFGKRSIYDSDESDDDFVDSSVLDMMLLQSKREKAVTQVEVETKRKELDELIKAEGSGDTHVVGVGDGTKVEGQRSDELCTGGSSPLSNGDALDGYQDALTEQPIGDSPTRTDDVIPPRDPPPLSPNSNLTSASQSGEGEVRTEVTADSTSPGAVSEADVEVSVNGGVPSVEKRANGSRFGEERYEGEEEGEEGEGEEGEGEVEKESEEEGVQISLTSLNDSIVSDGRFSRFDVSQSLLEGTFTPVEQTLTDSAVNRLRGAQPFLGLKLREKLGRGNGGEGGGNESDEYSSLPDEDEEGEEGWTIIGDGSTGSGGRAMRLTLPGKTTAWFSRSLDTNAEVRVTHVDLQKGGGYPTRTPFTTITKLQILTC